MQRDPYLKEIDSKDVHNVSDFIKKIKDYIDRKKNNNISFLFRGEPQRHVTFCRPNIFRKNVLSTNSFFEKSLFNSMRQNKLSTSSSYLENAIDAQHGEFPSRLLDVSYNCLNALYFAVTPYYHKTATELDEEDGIVFIFYIDEIFSPSAQNINDNYNAIIDKNCKWFNDYVIFEKNHKFIDHAKINNRIIAQQGAFILFQGNDADSLPAYMLNGIVIPKEAKPIIREELSLMFGINTGTIYPEIVNLADEMIQKSEKMTTEEFNWQNEIKSVLKNLRKELDYYLQYLQYYSKENEAEYYKAVQMVEMVINSYRVGIIEFVSDFDELGLNNVSNNTTNQPIDYCVNKNSIIERYNDALQSFSEDLMYLCDTSISEALYIGKDK